VRTHLLGGLIVLAVLFLMPAQAAAQLTDTFMLIPGIAGDSVDEAHRSWINVLSLTQSYEGNRSTSTCGATVTKGFDRSGPPLWLAAVTGQRFLEIRLEVVRSSVDRTRFYELRISNPRITAISSMPSNLSESLQIVGDSATLTFWPQNEFGAPLPPVTATVTCR
jgi:type VI protein secretion system component Hcp